MKRQRLIKLLKLLFAAGLTAFVIHKAGVDKIAAALSDIDLAGWVIGSGLVLTANCLAMVRWHLLMHSVGLNTTTGTALRLGFIGVFFNNLVPGLTGGDLVRAIYVARENPNQRASAAISVAVDRIIGIVALAIIAAVVIPLNFDRYGEAAIGIYGFLAVAGLGAVIALSRRAKTVIGALISRRGGDDSPDGKVIGTLRKCDQAVSMYRDRLGSVFVALIMSFAVHLLIIFALYLFAHAIASGGLAKLEEAPAAVTLGAEPAALEQQAEALRNLQSVSLTAYCSIVPIIMIGSAVPVAPAGWGVGEVLFAHFFKTVNVQESLAVALSFTYRITVLLVSLIGGVMLILDRRRVLEATSDQEGDSGAGSAAP